VAEARKNASTVVLKQFVCSFEQRGDSWYLSRHVRLFCVCFLALINASLALGAMRNWTEVDHKNIYKFGIKWFINNNCKYFAENFGILVNAFKKLYSLKSFSKNMIRTTKLMLMIIISIKRIAVNCKHICWKSVLHNVYDT
jgi:hypothetical protein